MKQAALVWILLAACALAQTVPGVRPRVFAIPPAQGAPAAPAPVPGAPPSAAPAIQVLVPGWQLLPVAQEGQLMDDGWARPGQAGPLGVVAVEGGMIVLSAHAAVIDLEARDKAQRPSPDLVFNPPLSMTVEPSLKDWKTVPASVVRTRLDSQGQVQGQEFALLGAQLGPAGAITSSGQWLVGELNLHPVGFCPVGSRPLGHLFAIPAAAQGLVAPLPIAYGAALSFQALAVDELSKTIYLATPTQLYRWQPHLWGSWTSGGRLEVLQLDIPQGLTQAAFQPMPGRATTAFWQAGHAGALLPAVRGLAARGGQLWISADYTSSGKGILMFLQGNQLRLYQSPKGAPDNPSWLAATPTGELLVVDNTPQPRLMLLTLSDEWKPLLQINSPGASITGAALSPDGRFIFFNLLSPNGSLLMALRRG